MAILRICILVATMPALPGCSSSDYDTDLLHAESMMEERPDSAYRILHRIKPQHLHHTDRALHSLLLTQAMMKLGMPVSSDSLLRSSISLFEAHHDTIHLIKANLYEAIFLRQQGKQAEAAVHATVSADLAEEYRSPLWSARAREQLADMNYIALNNAEALEQNGKVLQGYRLAGYERNLHYAYCDRAAILFMMSRTREAMTLLDSILSVVERTDYAQEVRRYINPARLEMLVRMERYADASQMLREMESTGEAAPSSANFGSKGVVLMYEGKRKEAALALDSAALMATTLQDTVYVMMSRIKYHDLAKEHEKARGCTDSLLYLYNDATARAMEDAAVRMQRDIYSRDAAEEKRLNDALQTRNVWITAAAVFFIIALGAVAVAIRVKGRTACEIMENRIISLDAEIEARRKDTSLLSEEIGTLQKRISALTEESDRAKVREQNLNSEVVASRERIAELKYGLGVLYQQHLDPVRKVWADIIAAKDSAVVHKSIVKRMEKEFRNFNSAKAKRQLENDIDIYLDGLAREIRSECRTLNEKEIMFVFYILAGFGAKLTCFLCGLQPGSFYTTKSRIVKKIAESDAPHKDKLLCLLTTGMDTD